MLVDAVALTPQVEQRGRLMKPDGAAALVGENKRFRRDFSRAGRSALRRSTSTRSKHRNALPARSK